MNMHMKKDGNFWHKDKGNLYWKRVLTVHFGDFCRVGKGSLELTFWEKLTRKKKMACKVIGRGLERIQRHL